MNRGLGRGRGRGRWGGRGQLQSSPQESGNSNTVVFKIPAPPTSTSIQFQTNAPGVFATKTEPYHARTSDPNQPHPHVHNMATKNTHPTKATLNKHVPSTKTHDQSKLAPKANRTKHTPKIPANAKSSANTKSPLTTPDSVPTDMVRPVLPPLYPDYVDGVSVDQMDPKLNSLVSGLIGFKEYFRSNYSIDFVKKVKSGFEPDRFTDNYDDPYLVEPRLQYNLSTSFLPKELQMSSSKAKRKEANEVNPDDIFEMLEVKEEKVDLSYGNEEILTGRKRKVDELEEDTDKAEKLEIKKVVKTLEAEDPEMDVDDDDEEDVEDEEMDEGNDYQNDYFDNGEDYLSEDDALEDTDVF